jgi:SAM-dependent methyltransferase
MSTDGSSREEEVRDQFDVPPAYFHRQLDFINWIRFYFLLRPLIESRPDCVLEVGIGGGFLRDSAVRFVGRYETLDVNERLGADYVGDVRQFDGRLEGRFDVIVAADVLEHIPFEDLPAAVGNLRRYLRPGGRAMVTIPHRRSNFMYMTPVNVPKFFSVPTGVLSPGGFYRRFIKRRIWIDPDHAWEIGDGNVKVRDVVQQFRGAGLEAVIVKKLFYVDLFVLEASRTR